MKFLELHLNAFGPFTDEKLDFVQDLRDHRGFHLIYGPNEAGKSSALRAIRYFLFGIPHNTRDNFVHEHSRLRIGARIEAADGREIVGIRRKGLRNTLRDASDRGVVESSELDPLLGAVDETVFHNLFGLDHEILVRGGEEILRGGGNIGRLLFAAGAGFNGLQDLLESLQREAEDLFKSRGSKPSINSALSRLADLRRRIKDSSLPSDSWHSHGQALQRARTQLEVVRRELASWTREKHRIQRIRDALPVITERQELLDQLDELCKVPLLPEDFGDRRSGVVSALRTERANAQQTRDHLREIDQKLGNLRNESVKRTAESYVSKKVFEQREAIEALHAGLARYRKAARDLPALRASLEQTRNRTARTLASIRPDATLDDGDPVDLEYRDRKKIVRLAHQFETLVHREKTARKTCDELRDHLELDRIRLAEIERDGPTADPDGLGAAVKSASRRGDLDDQVESARAEEAALLEECKARLHELRFIDHGDNGRESIEAIACLAVPEEILRVHELSGRN